MSRPAELLKEKEMLEQIREEIRALANGDEHLEMRAEAVIVRTLRQEDKKLDVLMQESLKKRFDVLGMLFDKMDTIGNEIDRRLKDDPESVSVQQLLLAYDIAAKAYIAVGTSTVMDLDRVKTLGLEIETRSVTKQTALPKAGRDKVRKMAKLIMSRTVDEQLVGRSVEEDHKEMSKKIDEFLDVEPEQPLITDTSLDEEMRMDENIKGNAPLPIEEVKEPSLRELRKQRSRTIAKDKQKTKKRRSSTSGSSD